MPTDQGVTVSSDPDAAWRRPAEDPAGPDAAARPASPARPAYTGPPRSQPPSAQAVPAPLIQPLPPPRELPAQDHDAIDAEERQARLVTVGISIVAGVLAVLLLLFVSLRAIVS